MLMNRMLSAVVMFVALSAQVQAGQIERYFVVAPGIPVAEGLLEDATHRMVFDSPSGRIVETAASGSVDWAVIEKFYLATLPELGWVLSQRDHRALSFQRDREQLILKQTRKIGAQILVELTIKPLSN